MEAVMFTSSDGQSCRPMSTPRAMVLCGDGINCERETIAAFSAVGFDAHAVHVNCLVESPTLLDSFQALALPGGFSFGDEMGSGQILALKVSRYAGDALRRFVEGRKPVIGICNGFQALTKMGLLSVPGQKRSIALAPNASDSLAGGSFVNRWVDVEFPRSSCIWTRGLDHCSLPVRHGEGRVVVDGTIESALEPSCIAVRYLHDVNGSVGRIAGICDASGVVLGLMPHPEAATNDILHPQRLPGSARGLQFFRNAYLYLKEI